MKTLGEKGEFMMELILQPQNEFEFLLVKEFIEKTGIKSRVLSDEDNEDFVLGLMMQEADNSGSADFVEWWKDDAFVVEMDGSYKLWKAGKEKAFTLEETDAAIEELKRKRKR